VHLFLVDSKLHFTASCFALRHADLTLQQHYAARPGLGFRAWLHYTHSLLDLSVISKLCGVRALFPSLGCTGGRAGQRVQRRGGEGAHQSVPHVPQRAQGSQGPHVLVGVAF
jgi:hypothetical protein